jgi:hypothetical protein
MAPRNRRGRGTAPHLLTEVGRLPLTHQALAAHPDRRAVIYLCDLLVSCGVLPAAGKQLLDYEACLHRRLAALAGSARPGQWRSGSQIAAPQL